MHMLPQPAGSAAAHHPFSKRHIYLIDLLQPVYMWQQWPLSGSTGFTACWQNPAFQERHICGVLSTDLDQQIDPWALGKGRDTMIMGEQNWHTFLLLSVATTKEGDWVHPSLGWGLLPPEVSPLSYTPSSHPLQTFGWPAQWCWFSTFCNFVHICTVCYQDHRRVDCPRKTTPGHTRKPNDWKPRLAGITTRSGQGVHPPPVTCNTSARLIVSSNTMTPP